MPDLQAVDQPSPFKLAAGIAGDWKRDVSGLLMNRIGRQTSTTGRGAPWKVNVSGFAPFGLRLGRSPRRGLDVVGSMFLARVPGAINLQPMRQEREEARPWNRHAP